AEELSLVGDRRGRWVVVKRPYAIGQGVSEVESVPRRRPAHRVGYADPTALFAGTPIWIDPIENAFDRSDIRDIAVRSDVVPHRPNPEVSGRVGATIVVAHARPPRNDAAMVDALIAGRAP